MTRRNFLSLGKVFLFFAVFVGASESIALADMIEVKGKGFVNGKIVSETEQEVRFEDSKGNVSVLARKDILFMERQTDKPAASQPGDLKSRKAISPDWMMQARRQFMKLKKITEGWTKKAVGWMSKPLDRSMADNKAEQFASAADQLAKTASGAASAESKQSKRMREAFSSDSNDDKGRFSHL